jgi:hypothetical protein
VREYIESELKLNGLTPERQKQSVVVRFRAGVYVSALVENIIARIPGETPDKSVLLVAHYDSIAGGPGAADNAAGVAALLETARALRLRPALENDVLLLFTDAEEVGLLGARAFVEHHPLAKDIGVVLNFEARGTSGPSFLFEVTPGNESLIRVIADHARYPRTSSLYYEIYKRMPNDTDLTAFRRAGVRGINLAFVEDPLRYHSSGDTPAALDRRSLQHHGEWALGLAQAFGNSRLDAEPRGDAVFFNLGNILFVQPLWSLYAICGLTLVTLLIAFGAGLRARMLSAGGVASGAVLLLGSIVCCFLSVPPTMLLLWRMIPELRSPAFSMYASVWLILGIVCTAGAVTLAWTRFLSKRATPLELSLGALSVAALIACAAAALLPGGAYLLAWPCVSTAICVCILIWRRHPFWTRRAQAGDECPPGQLALVVALAVPTIYLLAPMAYLMFVAFGVRAAAMTALLVPFATSLSLPAVFGVLPISRSRLIVVAFSAAVVLLVLGKLTTSFSPERPRHNNVFFATDSQTSDAFWASRQGDLDLWAAQYVGEHPERGPLTGCLATLGYVAHKSADAGDLSAPEVTVLADQASENRRTIQLLVKGHAPGVLRVSRNERGSMSVYLTAVNGISVRDDNGPVREPLERVTLRGIDAEGARLKLDVPVDEEITLDVIESRAGLPAKNVKPRLEWMQRGGDQELTNDSTIVCRTFKMAAARGRDR